MVKYALILGMRLASTLFLQCVGQYRTLAVLDLDSTIVLHVHLGPVT